MVLKTATLAASVPVTSFEGKADRVNEGTVGKNVGETGDMNAGATKPLTINLAAGHYVLMCNLEGHYRMGTRQDFTVS